VSIDIGRALQQLNARLTRMERSPRLSHASIDNTSVEIRDSTGGLKGLVGVQADGTAAVNIVNGGPPPQPSDPIVASVLGGVTVSWDGQFAGGAVIPLDWARVEVHAAITAVYDPSPATLQGTIETAQGATVVVPCDTPVYVRLVARNTSGAASTASGTIGPFGPTPVVADDLVDGIVTTLKLADDAVTAAKVAVGAIGSDQLALGIGNLAPDPSFEGAYTAALIAGHADWSVTAPGNNSAHALHVDCTSGFTTWKNIELARYPVLPGERHYLAVDYKTSATFNGSGVKLMFRYEDAAATVLGYGVADHTFTPGDPWARATAQVQAPTGTKTAVLVVEASAVTAGEAWFDNAEVRTLVAGGMIAAGSVTATEIAALTILAGNIAADAIAAGKIAADAVTAREIAALTITAAEIAANAITVGKIQAGAVDATALAANAITGKTITGGTITGALIQTATTGQRITLNESSANKVLVYNSSGTAIGELSDSGLLVKGTNGAILQLDPNNAFPNLKLTNVGQTASAIVNVSGANAVLGLNSGIYTGSSFSDMKWRTLFGLSGSSDFWTAERVRDSATNTVIGGRIALTDAAAAFGYKDTTAATQDAILTMFSSGVTQLSKSRYEVYAPASSSSALYATADSGHTGNLLRLSVAAVDKLTVDKDGNTTAAGTITAASSSTTTGLTAASGFTINSGGFYGYRFGKVVAIDLYMHRSGTTITSTSGNLTDVAIATLPAGWRPTHNTINGAWDDGTTFGGWVVGTDGICTLRTAYADITGDASQAGQGRNLRLHITFIQD
jgi:hypothetical protein